MSERQSHTSLQKDVANRLAFTTTLIGQVTKVTYRKGHVPTYWCISSVRIHVMKRYASTQRRTVNDTVPCLNIRMPWRAVGMRCVHALTSIVVPRVERERGGDCRRRAPRLMHTETPSSGVTRNSVGVYDG